MTSTQNEGPEGSESSKYSLSPQEAAYIDALLASGAVENSGAESAAGVPCPPGLAEIIHALSQLPAVEPPGDMAQRTIAAVGAHAASLRSPHAGSTVLTNTRRPGWTWDPRKADIAVMLIAASLLLAVTIFQLNKARVFAMQTACANNLAVLGTAFGQYAATNNNMLPRIAIPADHDWLPRAMTPNLKRAANAHCNMANLAPMLSIRTHYTAWDHLICPAAGTGSALRRSNGQIVWSNIGYSYIDELSAYHHHWAQCGQVAILADRNPLFFPGGAHNVNINSWNHNGRGQNVLYDDGSVFWTRSPDVGPAHDNIWTIGSPPVLVYSGVEEPKSPQDIILVP